jgi:hypothetical protein
MAAPRMITAIVRYKLPPHIDHTGCREHFHKIAPGFREVKGLISKHFIWSASGWAAGVYQWETLEDAKTFYTGPWVNGIVERYGMQPHIEFYEVLALTDNARDTIALFKEAVPGKESRGHQLPIVPRQEWEAAAAIRDIQGALNVTSPPRPAPPGSSDCAPVAWRSRDG